MTETTASALGRIHDLLARKGYSVTELENNVLRIQEVETSIVVRAVLEGDILFLSLVCMVAPESRINAGIMRKMLAADNGISTSHFQLYSVDKGTVAVTLSNFCTLQDLGAEDEDDILSCISFLLADVVLARDLIGAELESA